MTGGPVPLWLSLLVAVVAAGLAVMVWREQQKDTAIDARDAHTTTEEGEDTAGAIFRPQYALAKALGVPVTALLE